MTKVYSWPENHWHWPEVLTHQHGVRSGDYIFTGGQADLTKEGEVANPHALVEQVRNVIQFVEDILVDLDSAITDVVRWVVYYVGDDADEKLIVSMLSRCLPANVRPSLSTICLPALCYPGMRIELEAVAWVQSEANRNKARYIQNEHLPGLHRQFSHAVRCDDLIFTSDVSAIDGYGNVQHEGDLLAQTKLMMEALSDVLTSAGASCSDVLKLNVFYQGDGTAANWSEPARIRADYFTDPGPAATGIAVSNFAQKGLMTKIAVTAGVSAGKLKNREFSWPDGHWNWTEPLPYKHGNRFGNLIHVGGQVSLDREAKVLHPDDMVAQTRTAMHNIESVLAELGATLDDVVKVTAFYQGSASAEALHENLLIRSASYQSPGPATSGIPVTHLVYERMVIEIEVIAMLEK